jgi:RNA polymerase sigma-70 factor, ECF subfamily
MQITRSSATIAVESRAFVPGNLSASREKESDSRTIEGLKRRDPGAMTALYDRYGRIVYSVVYRIVGNGGEAEEIVQESFFRVWKRAHLIDDSCDTLRPWLLIIARNLSIDHLRSANGRNRCFERWGYNFLPVPVPMDHFSDHAEQLRRAFVDLPLEQRTVLEFAYFEGLSQTEIADRMQKPLGTVKTWVRTGLENLRKSFAVSVGVPNMSRNGSE